MAKITLPVLTTGYASITKLNDALQLIEDELNNNVLYRNNPTGEPNQLEQNMDMNSFRIYNLAEGVNDTDAPTIRQVREIAGEALGLTNISLYQAGLVIDSVFDWIEFNGDVYAPLASAIPFTTSGTFVGDDENRFRPISSPKQEYSSINEFLTSPKAHTLVDEIRIQSYYDNWQSTVGGPKGGGVLHKDGTTGTPGTIGTGPTAGRFFDLQGTGWRWSGKEFSPFMFGARANWNGTTGTDDSQAFIDMATYISSIGGGVLDFGGANNRYLLRTDADSLTTIASNALRTLCDFTDIDGLDIRSQGAELIISRDYVVPERDVVFRFLRCSNVHVGKFKCSYVGTRASTTQSGVVLVFLRNGNTNFSMDDQEINDFSIGVWDMPASAEPAFTNYWSGKRFTLNCDTTGYPYLGDNGGNGLACDIVTKNHGRGCTLQDTVNADVRVISTDFTASNDCGISGSIKNVNFNYINLLGTKAAQDDCVTVSYPSEYNTDISPWVGTHTGANGAVTLEDSTASFVPNSLVGYRLINKTDASFGTVISNTATTITATLTNGYTNVWNPGDVYGISEMTGTHDGASNVSTLSVSGAGWPTNALVGWTVRNTTDGSYGIITANTATTVSATLINGVENDWDAGDGYSIGKSHELSNVNIRSHVECFDGKFTGYALRVGTGVGSDPATRDPGYKLRDLSLSCILRSDDNVNQQSFQIEDPSAFSDASNFHNLRIYDSTFDGGLPPVIDVKSLVDICSLENITSTSRLQYSSNAGAVTVARNIKAPAISPNTADTSVMVIQGCDIGSSFTTHQSLINKQFIGSYANGLPYNLAPVLGQQLQSFTLNIQNNAGTLEHRIVVNRGVVQLPTAGNKINGATTAWNATPTVGAGTDFVAGVGITSGNQIVFNTAAQISTYEIMLCSVEYYDGGVTHPSVDTFFNTANVNGTTLNRLHFRLVSQNSGSAWNVNTTNIPAGKSIAIGFIGYLA